MLTTFQIDRSIAGVHARERLTIREWEGAWSMQRAMLHGQRLLIFLYPPSRLGLTSPVGGRAGQVVLNARGEIVGASLSGDPIRIGSGMQAAEANTPERATAQSHGGTITMSQLERAIRRARLTPTLTRRNHVRTTPGN
jgi:hypothetical protein